MGPLRSTFIPRKFTPWKSWDIETTPSNSDWLIISVRSGDSGSAEFRATSLVWDASSDLDHVRIARNANLQHFFESPAIRAEYLRQLIRK